MRLLLIAAAFGLSAASWADVKVTLEDYGNWKGAYRISNMTVDLVVIPQIGRVVRYGYVGKDNLIAEPESQQELAGDSLIPYFGSSAAAVVGWSAVATASGVELRGRTLLPRPAEITRRINLDAFGPKVTFRNSLKNLGERSEAVLQQTVAVKLPAVAVLTTEITSDLPLGYKSFINKSLNSEHHKLSRDKLEITEDPNSPQRIGVRSKSGEVILLAQRSRFRIHSAVPNRAHYQGGAAQIVETSPGRSFVEVSQVSPLFRPEKNEVVYQTVTWSLSDAPR